MYNWKIEVSEYLSRILPHLNTQKITDPAIDTSKKKRRDFTISQFGLLRYTAQSILTRAHIYDKKTASFAKSYAAIIPLLLSEKDGYLAFDKNNINILRDFSKSTRCGEIAQGINYAYAIERLGAYVIFDFKYYAETYKKFHKCNGATPDYIYFRRKDKKLGILESKGTMAPHPTDSLYRGYLQCENGKNYLINNGVNPANSYVSAVSFGTTSPRLKRNSCIYIADPSDDSDTKDDNEEKSILYEYSKFFYLAGNQKATEALMRGERLSEKDLEYIAGFVNNDEIIIGTWDLRSISTDRMVTLRMGIKKSLAQYLFGETKVFEPCKQMVSEHKEIFADGTFFEIE